MIADLLKVEANLLAGKEYKPNTLLVAYINSTDTTQIPTFSGTDPTTFYSGLASPCDYLKIPIVIEPGVKQTDSGYSVEYTVLASVTGVGEKNSLPFSNASNSTVFATALAVVLNENDNNSIILLTHDALSASDVFTVPASGTLSLQSVITLE